MTMPREVDHVGHWNSPADALMRDRLIPSSSRHKRNSSLRCAVRRYSRSGRATNSAPWQRIEPKARCCAELRQAPKSSGSRFVGVALGVASWVHYRGRDARRPRKTTDRTVRRPTNWSRTFSPTSLSPCGERTLRHRSLPSSDAACAPSSATWKALASGPARPSQRSSRKFSFVIECATSA